MTEPNQPQKTAISYVRLKVARMRKESIFSIDTLTIPDYSRSAIRAAINQLIKEKIIFRAFKGIYYKPTYNRFLKGRPVPPDLNKVIDFLCKGMGETIQIHAGKAINRLGLSTQVQLVKVFYTSGYSRTLRLNGGTVKFIHMNDSRILQHSGTNVGLAISSMYGLGKNLVNN